MADLIAAIEDSGIATWIRESPSILAFTLILSIHVIGLALIVGMSTVIALRLLGFVQELPLAPLKKAFPILYIAFWCNAISGLALFAAETSKMVSFPVFWIKLAFIALGVLVMRALRNLVFDDAVLAGVEAGAVPAIGRKLAVASLICWGVALIAGRLTSYPELLSNSPGFQP
jgi:hypothetical protein